jgi:hypothetical protein
MSESLTPTPSSRPRRSILRWMLLLAVWMVGLVVWLFYFILVVWALFRVL